eukprot:GAHX01001235.1.p1 GENE.GAHX01001235.1~~GAHX01001235.1.p1  ORF type:complete len:618 (+),score=158.37 GAHX01001235.1:46-1899(+)
MTNSAGSAQKDILHNEHGLPKRLLESRELEESKNIARDLQNNLQKTGITITRFPPEPNGYLHLGHAKAINFNFLLSGVKSKYDKASVSSSTDTDLSDFEKLYIGKKSPGKCYLRFDDSNPLTCSHEFTQNIKDKIAWLGFEPTDVTSASMYFPNLYDYAIQLIKQNDAYVCFLSAEEYKELREAKKPSPYRDTPVEKNLELFEKMSKGEYKKSEAVLKIKIDYKHPNPSLRDPPIFRIVFDKHPFVDLEKYPHKVFPLYDFTHCICDAIENITISCCTLEFENRRDLYYIILDKLKLYRPWVFEYSRLSLEGALTSKRKIKKLVEDKVVDGWDDPRLFTLDGLERRGVPPSAVNKFVRELGITRRDSSLIAKDKFESVLRKELDAISKRGFCVFEENCHVLYLDEENKKDFMVPDFPNLEDNNENHKVEFKKYMIINSDDYKEGGNKKYFGLTNKPEKTIRMKYCVNVNFVDYNKDSKVFEEINKDLKDLKEGNIINVKVHKDNEKVRKGNITFVGDSDIKNKVEIRLYKFNSEKMEKEIKTGIVTSNVIESIAKGEKWFQFERMGFFYLDKNSEIVKNEDGKVDIEKSNIIFNNVVDLKVNKERVKVLNEMKGKNK